MTKNDDRAFRNEVFTAAQAQQQGIPTRNVMRDDFDIEIPVESVPLPSSGVAYPVDSPLHGQETIEVTAMTAKEEDILTSRALIKKGSVITELLRSCIVNKNVNPNTMLSGDRNALMTAIRITGYGSDYTVEVDCPACSERSKQTFDLTELPIKRLEISPVQLGDNIFETELPLTKKKVQFKFLTGEDEREMSVVSDRRKKSGMIRDTMVTQRFQQQLVSVNGITDRSKINTFIGHMPAGDSLYLRKYIDRHEPGVDMKSWMDCAQCFESSEVRLPMGASFFWPDLE